jgi:cellobiose epimerase
MKGRRVMNLGLFKTEVEKELLEGILPYWMNKTVDKENGGFYGYITNEEKIEFDSDKGCILNSRILWTFSKAYMMYKKEEYLEIAKHAFQFLKGNFIDKEYKGLFWMLDYKGQPTETRKHIYNQSFGIYGLSEYYRATGDADALSIAKELFELIEVHSYDPVHGGYFEAFTREWKTEEDLRLSEKDLNFPKSMNTHLHIMEAYTNLYRAWNDETLKEKLVTLINITLDKIVDNNSFQFKLFFDEAWNSKSPLISYGHDIEGSWLLFEAAEVVGNEKLICKVKEFTIKMANKVYEDGFDEDGSILNEADQTSIIDTDKVWWVQAEGMVGFFNAYELTNEQKYLEKVYGLWHFTKSYMIDHSNHEWYWKLSKERKVYENMPKVEPWKCPYHNSRFCFELIERIQRGS